VNGGMSRRVQTITGPAKPQMAVTATMAKIAGNRWGFSCFVAIDSQ